MIILGDTLPGIVSLLAGPSFLPDDHERLWCLSMVTCIILLPLCLMRHISSLAWSSLFSLTCVLLFVVIVVVLAASGSGDERNYSLAKFDTDIFRAFSLFAFAFTCHSNVFPVYNELRDPSIARMVQVTRWSLVITFSW